MPRLRSLTVTALALCLGCGTRNSAQTSAPRPGQEGLPAPAGVRVREQAPAPSLVSRDVERTPETISPYVLERRTLLADGVEQSYVLYVPARGADAPPMPLVVLMHGAGGDGLGQIRAWQPLAAQRHAVLLAPDIQGSVAAWDRLYDHPEWIHGAIEDVRAQYPIDGRRLYLSGYSAGGMFAFYFAFLESRYFAAAAVQAGVIENAKYAMADFAERKIPLAYTIGTEDQWWSLDQTRASRQALVTRGFPVQYRELPRADHDLFAHPTAMLDEVWQFFARHPLDAEPRFIALDLPRIKAALR